MRIVAWILLAFVIFVIAALAYYLVVGAILFKFIFSRRSLSMRVLRKDTEKRIKENKIDLCWWEKVKFEKVEIKSFDGLKLCGRYYNAGSNKTAIVVHGFGGTHLEMQPYCKLFHDKNFNVLAVDCRAHGNSEGSCIGYGWLDRLDICSWAEFLQQKTPDAKVLLFGLSMGGAAVCMASGERKLPNSVVAAVSDCAFDSAEKEFNYLIKKRKILFLFKKHAISFVKRVYGFNVLQADALKQVKNTKIPIMYFHGSEDAFVPAGCMQNLYNATPQNLREKFLVEGATHAMAYAVAGVIYEKKMFDFIKERTPLN